MIEIAHRMPLAERKREYGDRSFFLITETVLNWFKWNDTDHPKCPTPKFISSIPSSSTSSPSTTASLLYSYCSAKRTNRGILNEKKNTSDIQMFDSLPFWALLDDGLCFKPWSQQRVTGHYSKQTHSIKVRREKREAESITRINAGIRPVAKGTAEEMLTEWEAEFTASRRRWTSYRTRETSTEFFFQIHLGNRVRSSKNYQKGELWQ